MPATVSHALSMTTPDNPAYENKPSNWNATHALTINATGSEISGAFSNANGISFGLSAGAVTASHNALTSQSNQALSAANGSFTFQTANFSNANGISFITSAGSAIAASVETSYAASNHSHGNPTLNLTNLSGTTASNSAGFTLSLSAAAAGGGGAVVSNAIQSVGSATGSGTNTSRFAADDHVHAGVFSMGVSTAGNTAGDTRVDVGRFVLQGGNNVTLSQLTAANALNTIIISGGAAGGADGINALVVNGGASTASTTLALSNSNNVSFGLNAGTITATATFAQTNQSAIRAFGVSNTGQTAGNTGVSTGIDWVLAGSQSITLSQSTVGGGPNTVWFQHPAWLTTAMQSNAVTLSNIRISGGTTSNLLSAITFGDANGISFGLNASTMTASHNALTSQSNQAVSNSAGSFTFQTLNFSNANNVTFGTSAGGIITASVNAGGGGIAASLSGNSTSGGAGYSNITSGTMILAGGPNITLSQDGSRISISANNPGAAAESNNINLLGANTAGNTTASGSTIGYSGINLTLSGTNGSVVNISAPATSSLAGSRGVIISTNGSTISVYGDIMTQRRQWPPGNLTVVSAMGNGSFSINRMVNYANMSATRLDVPFLLSLASSATANTWGLAVTVFGAVYTKNVSTLSSLSSGSTAWNTTLASNTAGNTGLIAHAIRPLSIPMNVTMSIGEYYVGFGISTNTSSVGTATTALGNTWSVMGGPIYSSAVGQVGDFTAATNTSTGLYGGMGVYSAAISTVPPTVSLSAINQTGSYYARGNIGLIFRNI